jgi:hypothetical protein
MTGIKFMHYHIYVPNTKVRIVPNRLPLLVNSYLGKKLMKLWNMMVIDKNTHHAFGGSNALGLDFYSKFCITFVFPSNH